MKSNRRSVLIGLGALTVGGGAVFGTGAFSSVEADRTATISVADDSSALLALSGATSSELINETDGTLGIDQDNINLDGTTTVNEAITITNNGANEVELSIDVTEGTDVSNSDAEDILGIEYNPSASTDQANDSGGSELSDGTDIVSTSAFIESGNEVTFDLVLDTTAVSLSDGDNVLEEVTFTATSQ